MASSYAGALGLMDTAMFVYNPMTQKFNILSPSTHDVGHSVGEARLGFDLIASSHFHVIEYVDVDGMCIGVAIYSSELQHGSIRNLNGARILI